MVTVYFFMRYVKKKIWSCGNICCNGIRTWKFAVSRQVRQALAKYVHDTVRPVNPTGYILSYVIWFINNVILFSKLRGIGNETRAQIVKFPIRMFAWTRKNSQLAVFSSSVWIIEGYLANQWGFESFPLSQISIRPTRYTISFYRIFDRIKWGG